MDEAEPSGAALIALRQAVEARSRPAQPSAPPHKTPSPPVRSSNDGCTTAAGPGSQADGIEPAQAGKANQCGKQRGKEAHHRPPVPAGDGADLFSSAARPATEPTGNADTLSGHRGRLRGRFDRGEKLVDYELLELLLFRAIPRRDTKPVAKAMIARFGSFAQAVSAPADQLSEIDGIGPRVVSDLRLVRAAAERFAESPLRARTRLTSTEAVAAYYRTKLQGVKREEFHILFLDKRNNMLATECAGTGTVDHTPVYPREVVAKALHHNASAIVLIHNHPSGDPSPSSADVEMTRLIVSALAPIGVKVHDHIIIGEGAHVSLQGEHLM
ncbi:MAG: DNA repair protein RadC [Pseudomonadota bacterium]